MKHTARWIALGVAVVLVGFAVVLATQVGNDPRADAKKSHLSGRPVPKFTVETPTGQTLTTGDLAGKAVIVNFWNSWCIPCRQEHPALAQWYAQHKDDPDVVLLGIVREDEKNAARQWVKDENVDWPVAFDPGGKAALDFGTRGQPETYAIGPDGVVAGSLFGPATVKALDQMVAYAQGSG